MPTVPEGAELARPFVPARDFALSKRFYEALGFEKLLDGEVAIFGIGSSSFILQNYFQKDWAENFMMQLMVDDLDGWWRHIEALDLPADFGVSAPRPPATAPRPTAPRPPAPAPRPTAPRLLATAPRPPTHAAHASRRLAERACASRSRIVGSVSPGS